MIESLAVTRDDRQLILEDEGGPHARLTVRRDELRMGGLALSTDDVKAVYAWTASWLADRYGSEASEDPGDRPKEWQRKEWQR